MAHATGQPVFNLEYTGPHQFKFEQAGVILIFDPAASNITLKQGGKSFTYAKDK